MLWEQMDQRRAAIQFAAAGRRNDAVHPQILHHLPIMIEAMPHDKSGHPQPRSHSSNIFRETAVTSLRGLNRTDSASNQFLNPEITIVLPAIRPR